MTVSCYKKIIKNIKRDILSVNVGKKDVAFYVECTDGIIERYEDGILTTYQTTLKNFKWYFLKLYDQSLDYRYEKYQFLVSNNLRYCGLHYYTSNSLAFFENFDINICNDNRQEKILLDDLRMVYGDIEIAR